MTLGLPVAFPPPPVAGCSAPLRVNRELLPLPAPGAVPAAADEFGVIPLTCGGSNDTTIPMNISFTASIAVGSWNIAAMRFSALTGEAAAK